MEKKNFHTHTSFCDGKNTAEEMVIAAIEKGFSALGFSGHSYTSYDEGYCMTNESTKLYAAEIFRLKEKYKDKIKIYCGIELDYYSDTDVSDFEYVIASVHAVLKDGRYHIVDESAEGLKKSVDEFWGGDYYAFAKDYFETVAKQEGDILGHIDLLTKYNEGDVHFSTKDKRYLSYAEEAIKKIVKKGMLFEINTGAISRGYTKTPYPSLEILKLIKKHGGRITLNSDCHNKDDLDCAFDMARELAKKAGFDKIEYLF